MDRLILLTQSVDQIVSILQDEEMRKLLRDRLTVKETDLIKTHVETLGDVVGNVLKQKKEHMQLILYRSIERRIRAA